jgi:hypothetical protein
VQQDVVQGLTPAFCGLNENPKILQDLLLAGKIRELSRPQPLLYFAFLGRQGALGRIIHKSSHKNKGSISTRLRPNFIGCDWAIKKRRRGKPRRRLLIQSKN